jgi:hypothetical protein
MFSHGPGLHIFKEKNFMSTTIIETPSRETQQQHLARIAFLEKENKELKAAITTQRRQTARANRELLFRERNLPVDIKERLHQVFSSSTDNAGLKEAINVELKRGGQ